MDPKETKTFESAQFPNLNQTSSKTQKTRHIPGVMPFQPSTNQVKIESEPKFWVGLRKPMKWVVTIAVPILILALIGSGLFNLVRGMIESDKTPQKVVVDRSTSNPSPTISTATKNECMDLPTRMDRAKITTKEVDKVFYQKYPDLLKQRWRERMNKTLGDTQLDRNLRQEWCVVANKLIQQE
jgi:hypothetical protein